MFTCTFRYMLLVAIVFLFRCEPGVWYVAMLHRNRACRPAVSQETPCVWHCSAESRAFVESIAVRFAFPSLRFMEVYGLWFMDETSRVPYTLMELDHQNPWT